MNTHPMYQCKSSGLKSAKPLPAKQRGVMLLEALIAILIFSFGILAIVGLQAVAIKNAGDAKYRTDASQLANQLIGQMWADDRTPAALINNYSSSTNPTGGKYQAWLNDVAASNLPLPTNPIVLPSINISQISNLDSTGAVIETSSLVTVTITWQAPNEATTHQYIAVAHIL